MYRVLSYIGLGRGNRVNSKSNSNSNISYIVSVLFIGLTIGIGYKLLNSNTTTSTTTTSTPTNASSNDDKDIKSNVKRGKRKVLILYGTCSGTAKKFSYRLEKLIISQIDDKSLEVKIVNVKDYDEDSLLHQEDIVLFLCSTWTDGTPPEAAVRFVSWLDEYVHDFRVSKSHLSNVKYAIFGLGSAIYDDNFCKVTKQVEEHFKELGAEGLLYPMYGDDQTDLESKFIAWSNSTVDILKNLISSSSSSTTAAATTTITSGTQASEISDTNKVVNKLNGIKSSLFKLQKKLDNAKLKQQNADNSNGCCSSNNVSNTSDCCNSNSNSNSNSNNSGCCSSNGNNHSHDDNIDEEEEEDRINSKYVTMDHYETDDDDDNNPPPGHDEILDMEDLGKEISDSKKQVLEDIHGGGQREMVTKLQRKALTKEGYRIIGSHSAVKLCRWTKNQMRGRGGCYKHTFYGITSYQCMEATPSLACANKCVFCWRHHKNPVGTDWRWKTDEPSMIVQEAVSLHQSMINEMRGVPGVLPERLAEGFNVRHCALSLVGEPIMYPRINEMLHELHDRSISSFLVTNAQFPDRIRDLDPVTQLYVSVDASTRDSLRAVDRPLFRDFWERFIGSLLEMKKKQQRTVYRMTLVKAWNMDEVDGYAELVEMGQPDFIEIKAVTYCGKSDASSLTMQNVPWHKEVCQYSEALATRLEERGKSVKYSIATEHEHSCCILLARTDKFLVNGSWHTWIDYDRFHQLMQRYYQTNGVESFTSTDYMSPTPSWALYESSSKGFDPTEQRWRRNKSGKVVDIEYRASESGCG